MAVTPEKKLLATHPNQELVQFFKTLVSLKAFVFVGFQSPPSPLIKSAKRNLGCALQHPDTVYQYLAD